MDTFNKVVAYSTLRSESDFEPSVGNQLVASKRSLIILSILSILLSIKLIIN